MERGTRLDESERIRRIQQGETHMKMDIRIILLYLLVPFNLTCLGCLWLLNRVRTPSCGYYCLIYCGLVALVQTILALNPSLGMFETSAIGVWLALLLLTVTAYA